MSPKMSESPQLFREYYFIFAESKESEMEDYEIIYVEANMSSVDKTNS